VVVAAGTAPEHRYPAGSGSWQAARIAHAPTVTACGGQRFISIGLFSRWRFATPSAT